MPALKIAEIYDYLFLKLDDFALLVNYILGDGSFDKFRPSEKYALMLLTNFFVYVVGFALLILAYKMLTAIMSRFQEVIVDIVSIMEFIIGSTLGDLPVYVQPVAWVMTLVLSVIFFLILLKIVTIPFTGWMRQYDRIRQWLS